MAATTSQGTGHGAADKPGVNELAVLSQTGPYIVFAGYAEAAAVLSSPPGSENTVTFPYALDNSDNYVVLLTSISAGNVYVTDMTSDETGFIGFDFAAESDGSIMYIVAKTGFRPQTEA